jgi:hypothetical protein
MAPAEVVKTESDIGIIWIDFRQKPGTACIGSKSFTTGWKSISSLVPRTGAWLRPFFQKAGLNIWGEKFHD